MSSTAGQMLLVFIVSLTPMVGVRASIPFGALVLGLPWYIVFPVAVVGDFFPVFFIIVFIKRIFAWLKKWGRFGAWVERTEEKALKKSEKVLKYKRQGLFFFGALPLPGTGSWMGSLVAALLNMSLKEAMPPIFGGVIVCAAILTVISYSGAAAFQWLLG